MSTTSKKVKGIHTKRFDIALMERPTGKYYVESHRVGSSIVDESQDIPDLNMAMSLFNLIFIDLEGN